jgi:uncharacterized protein YggE
MRGTTIAGIAVAGILLAACGSQAAQPNITVNNPGSNQTGISVSGTGEVTGTPDTVSVDLGVSVIADTVGEATAEAADKADALINSLTANGVDPDDITTTNYSIYPEYDYRNDTERLIGYRVTNTVRAKIREVSTAGDVLDAATAAGGDDVRVNGLQFSIEDDAELVEAARDAAWNDALTKAQQLADLSGQTLGAATSITETVSRPPVPIRFEASALAAADTATPIEPGTSAVTISLHVQFALED